MTLEQGISLIQDLRGQLSHYGVNNQALVGVALVGMAFFLLSLREVLSWFLRVNQIRNEVRALRQQISSVHQLLADTRELLLKNGVVTESDLNAEKEATEEDEDLAKTKAVPAKFRLDH